MEPTEMEGSVANVTSIDQIIGKELIGLYFLRVRNFVNARNSFENIPVAGFSTAERILNAEYSLILAISTRLLSTAAVPAFEAACVFLFSMAVPESLGPTPNPSCTGKC